jgi:putative membrane protein
MRIVPFVAFALFATVAAAEEPGSRETREFVSAATQSDQFEIWEARIALMTSGDPQVRNFAQHMIEAHTRTTRDLQRATITAGLEPPPEAMSSDQAQLVSALQNMGAGPDFDKTYWTHQAVAHRGALAVEQSYADGGDTPAIRQVARTSLPLILAHLQTAEQMKAAISPEG